jgi:hypothetical protein
MLSFVKNIQSLIDDNIPNYLAGDFNLPEIDWQSPDISGSHSHHLFAELVIKNGLDQLVTDCTRGDAILDLLLTDCNDSIINVAVLDSFSSSDHSMVWFEMLLPHNLQKPLNPIYKYDFARVNWEMVNQALSTINWLSLVREVPINQARHNFYTHIYNVIECTVPKKLSVYKNLKRIRYPKTIRKLQQVKLAKWKSLKMHPRDDTLKAAYRLANSNLKNAIYHWHCNHENKVLSNLNHSSFYTYVKARLKTSRHNSVLIDASGKLISSPVDVANEFNRYFASVFTIDDNTLPDFPSRCDNDFNTVLFDVLSVSNAIKKLKPTFSSGLDNIPNVFLKKHCVHNDIASEHSLRTLNDM